MATLASAFREDLLRLITRLPTSAWLCLLLASVWLTARWLWGAGTAHIAVELCAVEPNLIAHGRALGYAFAVKFTPFILLPLTLLPLAWSLFRTPLAERARRWNARGHQVAARELVRFLRAQGWLPDCVRG